MKQLYSNILQKLPPGFAQVFSNISRQFGGQIFQLGIGFFVGVWFARYLGPADYGLFNYAIAITSILAIFSTLGLDGIVVRELVKTPEKQNEIIGTTFILKLIGGFLVVLASSTLVYFLNSDQIIGLYLTMIISSIYILNAFNSIDLFFQAKLLSKYNVISKNIAFIIGICLKLIGLIYGLSIIYFAVIMVVEALISFVFFVYYYHKSGGHIFSWKFDLSIAKQLFHDSRPLIFASIFSLIGMRIDQVMIKNMLGDTDLGLYSAAAKIAEIPNFIPIIIGASIFPAIINYKKTNNKLYKYRLQQLYSLFSFISISIALIITIFSPFIIGFLFGNEYNESAGILNIYIWSTIPTFLSVAVGKFLVTENLQVIIFKMGLYNMITNIILNIILIPKYGSVGAAISTSISYSVTILVLLFHKQTRKQFFFIVKSFSIIHIIKNIRFMMKIIKKT